MDDLPEDMLDLSAEYFRFPVNRTLEARAVDGLREQILLFLRDMDGGEETAEQMIEADFVRLRQMDQIEPEERRDRMTGAIIHRLTRKRIIQWNLQLLSSLLAVLTSSSGPHCETALASFQSAARDTYESQMREQTATPVDSPHHDDDDDGDSPADPSLDAYLAEVDSYVRALASI